jgi:hypothetical protein
VEIILILLLVVGVIAYLGAAGRSSRSSSTTRSSTQSSTRSSSTRSESPSRSGSTGKQRILEANDEWLRERWRMADAEKAAGNLQHFPNWYFDEATDRQRNKLAEQGVSIARSATKGQHSDVIGLFEEPDDEEIEKLRFFGVTLKGSLLNQTRARHEVAKVHADPEKQRAWLMRPASALQKEFYRFIGEKPPAGLTFEQAEAKMHNVHESMTEAQQDEWSTLESLIDDFEDREFRNDVEIRKPSIADIRAAMAALKAEGAEFEDPYEVAEKLLKIKPALARASAP